MGIETLAAISIGSAVIGGGISAFGSLSGGAAEKSAYTYRAQVAENNRQISERNAQYAIASGETEAVMQGLKARAQMGDIKAKQAASSLDVNAGSPADVRESQEGINSFNEMMIRSNASKQSYGFKVEAMNQEAQKGIYKMAGDRAETAGEIGAAGSIVGAAGSVADKWYKFGTAGISGYSGSSNAMGV